MRARHGVTATAGRAALFCLTGTVIGGVVVLSDPNSGGRQAIQDRAVSLRKKILLKALTERLQLRSCDHDHDYDRSVVEKYGDDGMQLSLEEKEEEAAAAAAAAAVAGRDSSWDGKISRNRFFVVTAPDVKLTLAASNYLSRHLAYRDMNGCSSDYYDMAPRLVVPCGCRFGTGRFARLVEHQLLALGDCDDELSSENSREVRDLSEAKQSAQARPPAAVAGKIHICSLWDTFLLRATRAVLDTENLDQAALWSLQHALVDALPTMAPAAERSNPWVVAPEEEHQYTEVDGGEIDAPKPGDKGGGEETRHTTTATTATATIAATHSMEQEGPSGAIGGEGGHKPDEPGEEWRGNTDDSVDSTPAGRSSQSGFRLEIVPFDADGSNRQSEGKVNGGVGRALVWRHEQHALCGELVKWGWGLAKRGLGHVIVASPNPWLLADLKETLLEAEYDTQVPSFPHADAKSGEYSSADADAATAALDTTARSNFRNRERASAVTSPDVDEDKTVVVVRVALPSPDQQEQVVLSVAEELEVDDQLTATDVVMLSDLTGGRRCAVEDVLLRVRGGSGVAEACRAAVDDKALALAAAWGILSGSSPADIPETGGDDRSASKTVPTGEGRGEGGGEGEGDGSIGGSSALVGVSVGGKGGLREAEWAALWESMGVLSLPKVTVAAAPSPTSPVVPSGAMAPGQLLDACGMSTDVLFKLTREGWLEVSPAARPGSGIVLGDPEDREPVRRKDSDIRTTSETAAAQDPAIADSSAGLEAPHTSFSGDHHQHQGHLHPRGRPQSRRPVGRLQRRPGPTVHAATVPLDALARLENSFVGAAPLTLAAFRRMVDLAPDSFADPVVTSAIAPGGVADGTGAGVLSQGGGDWVGVDLGGSDSVVSRVGAGVTGGRGDAMHGVVDAGSGGMSDGSLRRYRWELERAGCLIKATVLGSRCRQEAEMLAEDGQALTWKWTELNTVRRNLEREGKGPDMSDGEWAEVQLELIRQERAVVASAEEMKTRRARLFEMWREAGTLKHRAATRSSPVHPPVSISSSLARVPQQQPQDEQASGENFLRALTGGLRRTESSPEDPAEEEHHSTSIFGGVVGDDGVTFLAAATAGAAAEESVLLDAEHGIRLMPLRNKNTNNDITTNTYVPTDNTNVDKRCETDVSGRSEQRTPGEGVGPTRDEGDVHVGYGSRVWRWLRRWL